MWAYSVFGRVIRIHHHDIVVIDVRCQPIGCDQNARVLISTLTRGKDFFLS